MFMCVCVCVCMRVCIYIHMHMCICVYMTCRPKLSNLIMCQTPSEPLFGMQIWMVRGLFVYESRTIYILCITSPRTFTLDIAPNSRQLLVGLQIHMVRGNLSLSHELCIVIMIWFMSPETLILCQTASSLTLVILKSPFKFWSGPSEPNIFFFPVLWYDLCHQKFSNFVLCHIASEPLFGEQI